MAQYSLTIQNNSDQTGDFCLFQLDPNAKDPNIMSLAWFSKSAHPNTLLNYRWETEYNFTWAETGPLTPGVVFEPNQIVDGGLSQNNDITFTQENGVYKYKDLTTDPNYNGLQHIECDATIIQKQAAIGTGMSGFPAFARQAEPNMGFNFSPEIEYRLTFGYYEQGEVLNINQISHFVAIEFPSGIYDMTATLNPDNTWTVKPL